MGVGASGIFSMTENSILRFAESSDESPLSGTREPTPVARRPSAGMPLPISAQRTASARARESARLAVSSPLLSVWPVMAMMLPTPLR